MNDTCGHLAGDTLLRDLANKMHSQVRLADTFARLGGDEFGLLLEACTPEHALRIANNLQKTIQNFCFIWEGRAFEISASIGLVGIHAEIEHLSEVFSAADLACYAAKESGRNRIHVYQKSDDGLTQRQNEMLWVTRIQQALKDESAAARGTEAGAQRRSSDKAEKFVPAK